MKSLRHDTLSAIPAPNAEGKTRIEPPADQRAMLKRLYLQQSWLEILEQADSTFSRGAFNHLWLDLQWYIHQALLKSGQAVLADIITADLKSRCAASPDLKRWPLMTVRPLPMRSR